MYDLLKQISELAHAELNQNGSIGYTFPNSKNHLFIYVDDSNGDDDIFYCIEANEIVENGECVPIATISADYDDFEELMLGCIWCITTCFTFSSNEMIALMKNTKNILQEVDYEQSK